MNYMKDIKGYEGIYTINKNGNIFSIKRKVKGRHGFIGNIEMKQQSYFGYKRVCLCKDNKKKKYLVHRLVALAFIPNTQNKPFINHIDCNPSNNNIENLEWCTQSENIIHSVKLGRQKNNLKGRFGSKNYVAIQIAFYDENNKLVYEFDTLTAACKFFNKKSNYFYYYIKSKKMWNQLTIKIKKNGNKN